MKAESRRMKIEEDPSAFCLPPSALLSDILIPELRVGGDERPHQLDASRILQDLDCDAARLQELFFAQKGFVFADDDARNAVEQNRAAAHGARRERGVDDGFAIDRRRLAPGILERVHFAVKDRAPLLYAPIVSATEDAPAVHQHRSDRDAALPPPFLRFRDRGAQELIGHQWPKSYSAKLDGASGSIGVQSRASGPRSRKKAGGTPAHIRDRTETPATGSRPRTATRTCAHPGHATMRAGFVEGRVAASSGWMARKRGWRLVARFGTFVADLRTGELRRNGVEVRIQVQPFRILGLLLERAGEIVTREELRERLWPTEFVDFDHSLNTAIRKLREALDDSHENPLFIETLARRGYRFIGPVTWESQSVPRPKNRLLIPIAMAVLLMAAVAALILVRSRPTPAAPNAIDAVAVLPFTNDDPQTQHLSDGLTES